MARRQGAITGFLAGFIAETRTAQGGVSSTFLAETAIPPPSPGRATGVGTASGVGSSTAVSTGSSDGVGTASGVNASLFIGVGSSSGVGSAAGVGSATFSGVAASSGTGVASGVGASTAVATGSASGIGSASGVGSAADASTGSSDGVGVASGVGSSTAVSSGSATGVGAAAAVGASTAASAGQADGVGSAAGVGTSTASAVGSASGVGSANGAGVTIQVQITAPYVFATPSRNVHGGPLGVPEPPLFVSIDATGVSAQDPQFTEAVADVLGMFGHSASVQRGNASQATCEMSVSAKAQSVLHQATSIYGRVTLRAKGASDQRWVSTEMVGSIVEKKKIETVTDEIPEYEEGPMQYEEDLLSDLDELV